MHTWTCASPAERNWAAHERIQVKRRNKLGFTKLTRLVEISTNLRLLRCHTRGVGYVLPWEDEDVVTEEERPEPRDSGVRPADKVTDEQLDRQVRKGRKDSLTRQPASVERYFGRRATILLPHEEDAVNDREPDPLAQDEIEEDPWSYPDDQDVESGRSSDDDAPLSQMRRETRGSTSARPRPSPRPRDGAATGLVVVGRPGRADAQCQGLSIRQRQHTSIDSDSDDDDGGYEGSSEFEDDMDFDSGAGNAPRGGGEGPRDIAVEEQHSHRHSARLAEERGRGAGGSARGGGDGGSRGQIPLSPQRVRSEAGRDLLATTGDLAAAPGSLSDILGMSMGPPPTAGDARQTPVAAGNTPISQVVRGLDTDGGVSSSLLMEAAQGMEASLDAARALETSVALVAETDVPNSCATGVRTHGVDEVEDGDVSRPAQGNGGVCRLGLRPIGGEDDDVEGGGDELVGGGGGPHGGSEAVGVHDGCEEDRQLVGGGEQMDEGRGSAYVAEMQQRAVDAPCEQPVDSVVADHPDALAEGISVLPLGGAMPAAVLECEGREDPLTADRRGRMEDASRRALGDPSPYAPCSPSVPSSMTGISPPPCDPMAQMESIRAACAANTRSWDSGRGGSESRSSVGGTQLAEGRGLDSLSPQSRMKARPHGLGSVRKVTQAMRDMQPGLAVIPASMRPPPLLRGGDVEWIRCPMGICNAPATFQRAMNMAFHNFVRKTRLAQSIINYCVIVYMDDILVYSSSYEGHVQHIEWALHALRDAGFKVAFEKCQFFLTTISFLGQVVTNHGLQPEPQKVAAVRDAPLPTTITQVRAFLGLASYYQRFIKGFAAIAGPLTNLLRKDQPLIWTPECDQVFSKLKADLISALVLIRPDPEKPFILITDWQPEAISAILAQVGPGGLENVVEYASRSVPACKRNYAAPTGECYAALWGISHFRAYLYGRKFTLVTDHELLLALKKSKDYSSMIGRWATVLQSMDFDIRHRKHERHGNADGLPRLHRPEKVPKSEEVIPWNEPEKEVGPRYGQVEILSKHFLFGSVRPGRRQLITQELIAPIMQLADDLSPDIYSQSDDNPSPYILERSLDPYLQWTACLEEPRDEDTLPSRQEYLKPYDIIPHAFYPKAEEVVIDEEEEDEDEGDDDEETSEEGSYSEYSEGELSEEEEEEEEETGSEWEALPEEAARAGTEVEDPVAARRREEIATGKRQLEFASRASLRIDNDPTRNPEPPKPEDGDPAAATSSTARRRRSRSPSSSSPTRPPVRPRTDAGDRPSSSDAIPPTP
ncbi:hypothetical protein CBR_g1050 [Chara braunii]|uniref:Reverse transcriptase domain-containing protein n=1 Tax=Chara braunii TaxID=69332 RepID=A0A388KD28_CHABU|nr:hypothetical protein CBR_g1050 [Chara braunii]|eukprot:GBG67931.1 hypothetical protein CBR_g1050 [Chara braunii]